MNPPLVFLCCDVKLGDIARDRFLEEMGSCGLDFRIDDWSVAAGSPPRDWEKLIHARIGRCDCMIVLVQKGMDLAAVAGELRESKRCNVPFFGVRVAGTSARAELPEGLPANRVIPWDWERIASAIRQSMKEGKHHVFA